MNQLLSGGRPSSALAQDCCYRGISALAKDIEQMQREKSQIQTEYEQSIKVQHDATQQLVRVREQNQKLTNDLISLRNTALNVESEANKTIDTLHQRNATLKVKNNLNLIFCLFF